MAADLKQLWKCPRCGHEFVTRNMWHSCGRFDLNLHFEGCDTRVRETFDAVVEAARECGPLTVYAQKTRIVFMVRVRFGGVVTRKRWLKLALWLTKQVDHPKLDRVETFGPASYGHHFRLESPGDVDEELRSLICAAYAVGCQEHLKRR